MDADSAGAGQGSEFVVRLPAGKRPEAHTERSDGWSGPIVDTPRRIVVVDDNVDVAKTLAELLALWGHDVRVAHGGPEAIEAGRASRPEVIPLDLNLDETDGCAVARRLGDEALLDGVLLVAVTGYGQEEDRRRSQVAGFQHHLTKPLDMDVLRALIVRMPDR